MNFTGWLESEHEKLNRIWDIPCYVCRENKNITALVICIKAKLCIFKNEGKICGKFIAVRKGKYCTKYDNQITSIL